MADETPARIGCCRAAVDSDGFAHDHEEWLREVQELRSRLTEVERQVLETSAREHQARLADVAALVTARAERDRMLPVVEAAEEWRHHVGDYRFGSDYVLAVVQAVDLYSSTVHPPTDAHSYLSTACYHGLHDRCGTLQAERGETGPPHCKFCPAPCSCPHHLPTPETPNGN